MDTNTLLAGLVFGSIGAGMFMYGKKAGRPIPMLAGAALVGVPYFIPNVLLLILVCTAITSVPWFMRHA